MDLTCVKRQLLNITIALFAKGTILTGRTEQDIESRRIVLRQIRHVVVLSE